MHTLNQVNDAIYSVDTLIARLVHLRQVHPLKNAISFVEGVHSMFLRKKNLKFFCCSFEKNVFLRMCIQQQMRMFSMSH